MDQKHTLWNMPSESWNGVPKNLKVTEEVALKVKVAMEKSVPEEELLPYKTPVDQERMARIIG